MATNDFIGFASNGSANIMSQVDYAAASEQGAGVQPGMASSKLANKIWRQGANMAAALGRIAAARGYNALDNGDLNALQSAIDDTISVGTFNRMYFSQTSGNYTAPRTGVYRITLKGGGGGGGPCSDVVKAGGGGGGEGATLVFYEFLTKDQSYAYTIGAGGAAAPNITDSGAHKGDNGGYTSFDNLRYVAGGGTGGGNNYYKMGGGAGGVYKDAPTGAIVHLIQGQQGQSGTLATSSGYGGSPASGGGTLSGYGAGGKGAYYNNTNPVQASDGTDGYILIEYAG